MYRCPQCHHHYCILEKTLAPDAHDLYGDSYAGFRADLVFEHALEERLETDFARFVPQGGRILDVGCGNGDFLSLARARGYTVQGIDVSASSVRLCRTRGLEVLQGTLLEVPLSTGFDVVTLWDVIEHVPNPVAVVRRAWDLLEPGGHLVVKTPLVRGPTFRIVTILPLLAASILQVPSHVQFFTRTSVLRLAEATGFEPIILATLGAMRQRPRAGSLRKRLARLVVYSINLACRNGNLYAWLRRRS